MEIGLAVGSEEEQKIKAMEQRRAQDMSGPLAPQKPGMVEQMGTKIKDKAMNDATNKVSNYAMDAAKPYAQSAMNAINPMASAGSGAVAGQAAANVAASTTPSLMGMGGASLGAAPLATTGAAAGGGALMAGIGTAMPYVGAAMLADKALGLGIMDSIGLANGGQIGPLNSQYYAQGGMPEDYNYKRPRYSPSQGVDEASLRAMQDAEAIEEQQIREAYERLFMGAEGGYGGPGYSAGGPISAQGTMSEEQARALMNNQPEPMPQPPMRRPNPYDQAMENENYDPLADSYVSSESLSPPGFSEEMAKYMQAIGQPFGGRQ